MREGDALQMRLVPDAVEFEISRPSRDARTRNRLDESGPSHLRHATAPKYQSAPTTDLPKVAEGEELGSNLLRVGQRGGQ